MPHAHKDDRQPSAALEHALQAGGFKAVAGIDEAGRGAWAGPVVAAAIILPLDCPSDLDKLSGVRDSKLMTPLQREKWSAALQEISLSYGIGQASNIEIDQVGIVPATRLAMMRACQQLCIPPQHLVIDYMLLPELACPQTALPHGDAVVLSIAAASVLAKVARDHMMIAYDEAYPGYGFARHKGYGTRHHRDQLHKHQPCAIHRFSYAPVQAAQSAGDVGESIT